MMFRATLFSTALCLASLAVGADSKTHGRAKSKGRSSAARVESSVETRDVASVLQDCQESATRRDTFVVPFTQETFSALRNRSSTQSGELAFKSPRSFRWEVTSPRKELYVSNGVEFWKYSEAAKHAQKMSASLVEMRFLDAILRPGMLGNDFDISPWKRDAALSASVENGSVATPAASSSPTPAAPVLKTSITDLPPELVPGRVYAKLIPKVKSKQQAMYLVVDRSRCIVEELRVFYENGNRSRIEFGKAVQRPLEPNSFEFFAPPGTAIDK